MTYTNGIWVSITPISRYDPSIRAAGELPPVEEFFPPEDYPVGLATGEVRGHRAWLKEQPKTFSCQTTASQLVPGTADSVMYDPTEIADMTWIERGVAVDVAGPYELAELQKLADGITWRSAE